MSVRERPRTRRWAVTAGFYWKRVAERAWPVGIAARCCGSAASRTSFRKAEAINFAEGSSWDETAVGTNAPGTALRLDAPVVIQAAEHVNRSVQNWSCAAADPRPSHPGHSRHPGRHRRRRRRLTADARHGAGSGSDGGDRARQDQRRGDVAVRRPAAPSAETRWHTSGTGAGQTRLRGERSWSGDPAEPAAQRDPGTADGPARRPDREQLEVQLYPTDVHRSTMRAEITRLRTLLGPHVLQSRPYRLLESASGDWQVVGRHLGAGRVAGATASYRGPLLPYSDAPGVVEIREGLHRELRSSLLGSDVPDLMASWTRTRSGADDLPMSARQAQLRPTTSPMRTVALAETRRLDRAFGLRAAGLH